MRGVGWRLGWLQNKMHRQWRLAQVHFTEVQPRSNETHFVTELVRHERGLGVVEDDALLVVLPTWALVNLGTDRMESERRHPILQEPLLRIEDFALPGEITEAFGDFLCADRAGCDDAGPVRLAAGNLPGWAVREQLIQLLRGHLEQFLNIQAHWLPPI